MPFVPALRLTRVLIAAVVLAAIAYPIGRPAAPARAAQPFSYWAPWYDNASPGMAQDNIHVLNPTATAADVTITLPGAPNLGGSVPAYGEQWFTWPFQTQIGGPLHVTASQAVIVSERVTYGYSFNEFPVSAESSAGTSFWFPWFDRGGPGFIQDNIHLVNPTSSPAHVTLRLGAGLFTYSLTVGAREGTYYSFPSGFVAGPVHVNSDQAVLVSQRVTYNQSFNEIPGVPDAAASTFTVFNWYDWASPGFNSSAVHVTNPSPGTAAHVHVTLAGADKGWLLVAPQTNQVFSYPGEINGPLLLTSDIGVIATQRVDYWGSFKEYPGLTTAGTSAWFNWYDNASPCFVQNNIHIYSAGHAFGNITMGAPGQQQSMSFDVTGERWFSFALGTIGGPVHVQGGSGSAPFYAESRTVRCPPPPPPPAPPPVPLPTTLRVPALGINTSVESVGPDGNGNMGVPSNPVDVAWFNLMPRPGDGGDAVITGHRDWYTLPWGGAPFWNLTGSYTGMDIYVDRADGSTVHFVVDGYNYFSGTSSPPDWLYTTQGAPQLSLITCAGDFNGSHYSDRYVVHSHQA